MQLQLSPDFFDQLSAAVLVLAKTGEVQSANAAARRMLGVAAGAPVKLEHLCPTEAHLGAMREAVRLTARGQNGNPLLVARDGGELEVRLARADQGGVTRVVATLHPRALAGPAAHCVERFAIKTTAKEFGRVLWHQPRAGHEASAMQAGSFCFKQRFPRGPEVCATCPARSLHEGNHSQLLIAADNACAVLDIAMRPGGTAEVQVHYLSDHVLEGLPRARLVARVNQSGLTARERLVLDQLLSGATRPEIARRLGIAARTVKFHERNLRAKLGADSRLDLFRVLI